VNSGSLVFACVWVWFRFVWILVFVYWLALCACCLLVVGMFGVCERLSVVSF